MDVCAQYITAQGHVNMANVACRHRLLCSLCIWAQSLWQQTGCVVLHAGTPSGTCPHRIFKTKQRLWLTLYTNMRQAATDAAVAVSLHLHRSPRTHTHLTQDGGVRPLVGTFACSCVGGCQSHRHVLRSRPVVDAVSCPQLQHTGLQPTAKGEGQTPWCAPLLLRLGTHIKPSRTSGIVPVQDGGLQS